MSGAPADFYRSWRRTSQTDSVLSESRAEQKPETPQVERVLAGLFLPRAGSDAAGETAGVKANFVKNLVGRQSSLDEKDFISRRSVSERLVPTIRTVDTAGTLFAAAFFLFLLILASIVIENPSPLPPPGNFLILNSETRLTLEKQQHAWLDLEIPGEGIYLVYVLAELDEGRNPIFDPTLTLWERPDTVFRYSDNIGALQVNPVIYFEVTETTGDLVADISSVRGEGAGSFVIGMMQVNTTHPLPVGVDEGGFLIDDGALFVAVRFEEGKTYTAVSLGGLDEKGAEDFFNTALRIRNSTGEEVDLSYQSTSRDFSARVIYTAPTTDIYIFESRKVGGESGWEVRYYLEVDLIPVNFDQAGVYTFAGNKTFATANDFLVSFKSNHEYTFTFNDTLLDFFVTDPLYLYDLEDYIRNISYSAPVFYPGLSVRIENYITGKRELLRETELDFELYGFQDIDEEWQQANMTVREVAPLAFTFTPVEDLVAIVDVLTINPFYYPAQDFRVIGEVFMTITESADVVQEEVPETNPLVNIFRPYESCERGQPNDFILDGCHAGTLLFCRQEFFPFKEFTTARVSDAHNICECMEVLCTELSNSDLARVDFDRFRDYMIYGIMGVCITALFVIFFVGYELLIFPKFRHKVSHRYSRQNWALCFFFFISTLAYCSLDILLREPKTVFRDLVETFVEEVSDVLERTPDLDYYGDSPLPEVMRSPTTSPTIFEQEPLLEPDALAVIPKSMTFDVIKVRLVLQLIAENLMLSTAFLCFFDVCVFWLSVSPDATLIHKRKRQMVVNNFRILLRVIEVILLGGLLWFTGSLAISNGQTYSNSASIFLALTSVCVLLLFIYARQYIYVSFGTQKTEESTISSADYKLKKFINLVGNTSLVIILSSMGLFITSIYFAVNVKGLSDLGRHKSVTDSIAMELFQLVSLISGVSGVIWFLYMSHLDIKYDFIIRVFASHNSTTSGGNPSQFKFNTASTFFALKKIEVSEVEFDFDDTTNLQQTSTNFGPQSLLKLFSVKYDEERYSTVAPPLQKQKSSSKKEPPSDVASFQDMSTLLSSEHATPVATQKRVDKTATLVPKLPPSNREGITPSIIADSEVSTSSLKRVFVSKKKKLVSSTNSKPQNMLEPEKPTSD